MAVNQPTLVEELKHHDQLDDVGGAVYLTELAAQVTTTADIDGHTRIVLEKALSRQLIGIANDIIEQAYKGSEDLLELINRAEQRLSAVCGMFVRVMGSSFVYIFVFPYRSLL